MKKNLFTAIFGLLFVFYSCQNEDTILSEQLTTEKTKATNHFYGVATPLNQSSDTKGVAQRSKLWENGVTITVNFVNDPYNASEKIRKYAQKWEEYANIRFKFIPNVYNADVRIGFDWKDKKSVTWSYTGTDCKLISDQKKPTVNFADWNYLNEEEQEGDVLRAFGQVLGLELEHRHLDFDPGWKSENKIASLWVGDITDIPWGQLREYVFTPLEQANVEQTKEYDSNSIMIWPFPRGYAQNTARDYNSELSSQDIDFIEELYPRENLECIMEFNFIYLGGNANLIGADIEMQIEGTTIPLIDYGDGTIKSQSNYGSYTYSKTGIYHVMVYANPESVRSIGINAEPDGDVITTELNLREQLENLKDIDLGNITNSNLDFSLTPNITSLSISNMYHDSELIAPNIEHFGWDYITQISEAPVILYLEGLNKLESIYISNISNLELLSLETCTSLSRISVENNSHYLLIPGYPLSETRSAATSTSDEGVFNIVNNLPSNSGKIKIKSNNNSDLIKIKNIVNSKGWTLEN